MRPLPLREAESTQHDLEADGMQRRRRLNRVDARSEEAGAEIKPIGQAQHEHEQHGGGEHREMADNEFAGRRGDNNGFLRNGHDGSNMKNDSWPPICGARIRRRDLQNNY